jgi:hypothetical protein
VGFNPFRRHSVSPLDVVLVAGAIVAAVALVLWAVLG